MSGDLVYSNDLRSAFLAAIVKSFANAHPRRELGRTAVQKLTYFTKVLGVPVPCSFGIYTYGPYSDQVTFTVASLLADDVIEDRSRTRERSNYRPGPNSQELLSEFANDIRPYKDRIKRVVSALGKLRPNQLELVSTLHFIVSRQKQIRKSFSEDSVLGEFKSIKGDKFRDRDIRACYESLVDTGLV
ncbi:MAG: hypothetical protein WAN10_15735 [Candidatus Acidiferrales bacterium]